MDHNDNENNTELEGEQKEEHGTVDSSENGESQVRTDVDNTNKVLECTKINTFLYLCTRS